MSLPASVLQTDLLPTCLPDFDDFRSTGLGEMLVKETPVVVIGPTRVADERESRWEDSMSPMVLTYDDAFAGIPVIVGRCLSGRRPHLLFSECQAIDRVDDARILLHGALPQSVRPSTSLDQPALRFEEEIWGLGPDVVGGKPQQCAR